MQSYRFNNMLIYTAMGCIQIAKGRSNSDKTHFAKMAYNALHNKIKMIIQHAYFTLHVEYKLNQAKSQGRKYC